MPLISDTRPCPGLQPVPGGVTAAQGFKAGTAQAGIKYPNRDDVALLVSSVPAVAAGVFTTNLVQAAPVRWCREQLRRSYRAQAILINSGNANACTGPRGLADAKRAAQAVARTLRLRPEQVLICSTGTIGIPLPMDRLLPAIPRAAHTLSPEGGPTAARAIMTTDTRPKESAVRFSLDGTTITIGGMAKGAGMIDPHMATLLVFMTTDAAVAPRALRSALRRAVEASFNRISVDGDRSTNDTALLLANGLAGHRLLSEQHPGWSLFTQALTAVARDLARQVVADGEGATRLVTVEVQGARTDREAILAARAVARSLLVKTAWYGGDPNWGRILCALGYSGARFDPDRVQIRFDNCLAVRQGRRAPGVSLETLARIFKQPTFRVSIHLGAGQAAYDMLTCDCSVDYVKINGAYMT
jgi:glutamate N-acetyltransferase/amino-acid N-acetyltransferase